MISELMIKQVKDDLKNYKQLHAELSERRKQLEQEEYKQAGVSGVSLGENVPTVSLSEHVKLLDNIERIEAIKARIADCENRIRFVNDVLQIITKRDQQAYTIISAVYFEGKRYDDIAQELNVSATYAKYSVTKAISIALRLRYKL